MLYWIFLLKTNLIEESNKICIMIVVKIKKKNCINNSIEIIPN